MIKKTYFKQYKSLPIWLWFVFFAISIIGIFIIGFNPEYLDTYWKYLAIYNSIIIIIAIFYLVRFFAALKINTQQKIAGSSFSRYLAKIIPILTIIPMLSFYAFSFKTVQDNLTIANTGLQHFNNAVIKESREIHQDLKLYQTQNYIDKSTQLLKIIHPLIDNASLDNILNRLITENICKIEVFKDNELFAQSDVVNNCDTWKNYQLEKKLYYIDEHTSATTALTQLPLSSITSTKQNIVLSVFYEKKINFENIMNRSLAFQKGMQNANITLSATIITRQFLIDFSTTILLTILSMLIIVQKMLEKIMIPLNELSIASRKISEGGYAKISNTQNDEDITNLIHEFNAMSLQIKRSKKDIENKNIYLETIIKHSSGIIAMDSVFKICLYNEQVLKLLNVKNIKNKHIDILTQQNSALKNIISNFKKFNTLNENLKINNYLLDITGIKLKGKGDIGYILIIKDISNIIKTQKLQAWNEVAKKMAHEIKNPLNPILLSAQRLRNKYLISENAKDNQVIDKTTKTIISQVESISLMVGSFAEYGRSPDLHLKKYNLNDIIKNSISLYDEEYNITLNLTPIPELNLDKNSINRVLINLIKNSIEASENNLQITINTYAKNNKVFLEVIDNGKGFDKNIINEVFEPHITNKKTGSGLGMAIIQKIITSHNGEITIDTDYTGGAKISIVFKENLIQS